MPPNKTKQCILSSFICVYNSVKNPLSNLARKKSYRVPKSGMWNIWNINRKLIISQLVHDICPQFLHQTGGFGGQGICLCKQNLPQTYPCYHGNEKLKILTEKLKIRYNSACIADMSPIFAPSRGFWGSGNLSV